MARGGVFLLALLLLVPSANYQYFDGPPLDGWQEFADCPCWSLSW